MIGGFLHPLLALGAGLALVPLVIHLLNRQRYRPMPWAAMRFVLAAYRRTRRRVELENLLLLLLRMAGLILLALAAARPFTSSDSPLSALTESRRDLLIALDASASTGYREEGQQATLFEQILVRAKELVGELDAGRGDRVHLILAGSQPRSFAWMTPDKALAVLSSTNAPTDEALDLTALLSEIRSVCEEDAAGTGQSTVEVRFLGDLQRSNFLAAESGEPEDTSTQEAAPQALARDILDALAALDVRVQVEDHGASSSVPANLAVTAVEPIGPIPGPGQAFDVAVRVQNYGTASRVQLRVALDLDGQRLPSQRVDLAAGESAEVAFALDVADSGSHSLVASLEGDRLGVDDQRPAVIEVPAPLRVLVVNGASGARITEDEVGYLMAVIEAPRESKPGQGALPTGFDPREVPPEELGSSELEIEAYDVIVLANVAPSFLSPSVIEALEKAVAHGAGLVLAAGDRWVGDGARFAWNEKLYRADGTGLLPAEIRRHVSVSVRREGYFRVRSFDQEHPVLAFFAEDVWKPFLTELPVYDFLACRPLEDARVLARLDDEGESPLLVERSYDRGRVLFLTTSLDRAWTLLPEVPRAFIPFVHELLRYAGRRRGGDPNLLPGAPIVLEVASFPRSPILLRPDSESRIALEGAPEEARSGHWRLPPIGGEWTAHVGLYKVEMEGTRPAAFAVALDPVESDLARLSAEEVTAFHPALLYRGPGASEESEDEEVGGARGELWRWLALAALLAVVGESLWGAYLGYKRRVA